MTPCSSTPLLLELLLLLLLSSTPVLVLTWFLQSMLPMSPFTLTHQLCDTAGGADSIVLGVTSASVYGAAGNDTLAIHGSTALFMQTWVQMPTALKVLGNINTSTLIGGACARHLQLRCWCRFSIVGGDGADSVAFAAALLAPLSWWCWRRYSASSAGVSDFLHSWWCWN